MEYRPMLHIFPDNSKIVTSTANVYNKDDTLSYISNIPYLHAEDPKISDMIFNDNKMYIIQNSSSGQIVTKLIILSAEPPYDLIGSSDLFFGEHLVKMYKDNDKILFITKATGGLYKYYYYSFDDLELIIQIQQNKSMKYSEIKRQLPEALK